MRSAPLSWLFASSASSVTESVHARKGRDKDGICQLAPAIGRWHLLLDDGSEDSAQGWMLVCVSTLQSVSLWHVRGGVTAALNADSVPFGQWHLLFLDDGSEDSAVAVC